MDLNEVLKEKRQLEKDIRELITSYESRTRTKVVDIELQAIKAPSPTIAQEFVTVQLSIGVSAET